MRDKNKLIENAKTNFKFCYDNAGPKYQYLPEWLSFKSNSFKNDYMNGKRREFFELKRGTLVYAKLGVNIGSEFSGNHFCIVLDKEDSIFKETVTVVPLSSKQNRHYLKIHDSIFSYAEDILKEEISKARHTTDHVIEEKIKRMEQMTDEIAKIVSDKSKSEDERNSMIEEHNRKFKELKDGVNKVLEESRKKIDQMEVIINRYGKFEGSTSYVHINSIKTISKSRMQRINHLDPTGKVQISPESMEAIDREILNRFIGYNN